MKILKDLHKKQSQAVGTLDWTAEGRSMKTMSDVHSVARRTMSRVSFNFDAHSDSIGSWIAGNSLALQIFDQARMTVDLTLDQLRRERPYDMPFESLCQMAEADLLYLNFRDYDSDSLNDFRGHKEERVKRRVEDLFSRVANRLYVGSAVRMPIFDTALKISGYEDRTVETIVKDAQDALSESAACFRDALVKKEVALDTFRGENHSLIATSTHWGYLSAVAHLLPVHLIGKPSSDLNVRFDRAVEAGVEARGSTDGKKRSAAAVAFVDLARRLRSCHLNFTAPITASWGTTYNMTSAEYESAGDIRDYWNEPAAQMKDNEVSRYVLYFLQEATDTVHPSFKSLGLGEFTLKERIDEQILTVPIVESLIKMRIRNDKKIEEAAQILADVKKVYMEAGVDTEEGRLRKLLSDYKAIESEKIQSYAKSLEGVWSYLIVPAIGTLAFLSQGIFPWLVQLAGDGVKAGIAPLVERMWRRPPAQRGIHRVRRQLTTLRQ
jgi:hypothetical protein